MSIVTTMCQVITNVFETIDLVKTVSDVSKAESGLEKAELVAYAATRSLALACNTVALGGKALDAPTKKILSIKNIETAARALNLPIAVEVATRRFLENLPNEADSPSASQMVSLLEKSAFVPLTGLLRCLFEAGALEEKAYLELSPEEFASTMRPIVEGDLDDSWHISGYKPLDRDECLNSLEMCSSLSDGAKVFEATVQAGLLTTCTIGMEARYKKLAELLRRRQQPLAPGEQPRGPALLDPAILNALQSPELSAQPEVRTVQVQVAPQESLDLLRASSIPEALHDDVVLSANICPISMEPIRHPVGDPNNRTIYERDYIYRVIDQSGKSPITRLPLTREQLIPRPDLQAVIDNRLKMYQDGFRKFIVSHQNQQPQS